MNDFIEDGVIVEGRKLTDEELKRQEQDAIDQLSKEQQDAIQLVVKESALQKLADLGLTLEEARAVIGI